MNLLRPLSVMRAVTLGLLYLGSLVTELEGRTIEDETGEVEILATVDTTGASVRADPEFGEVAVVGVADSDQLLVAITVHGAGMIPGDFNDDGKVDLSDFFLFADAFGGTDPEFDLTNDGKVGLLDFFLFADSFGAKN